MLHKPYFLLGGILLLTAQGVAQEPPPVPPQNPPASAAAQKQQEANAAEPGAKPKPARIIVPSGTRLPLVMHNSISTRSAKPGDPIYLETTFPVVAEGRIVIPAGSYVSGEVVEAKRPGKVKGRGELHVRLNTLILPNGYAVDFNAIPTGAGTGANDSVEEEGKIKGDTDKGSDVGTVMKTTGAGAGIGSIAGGGKGAGIGAGIGAAAGLMGVLFTRGPELILPRGSTLDIMLDRPLYLDADKINFTDPGRASSLAGPDNRQPVRQKVPF
jgi:type IV secretion system protein VirB10